MCEQKHKHYDTIIAWANGKQVQVSIEGGEWNTTSFPSWAESYQYRIKPEPKPDIVTYGYACYIPQRSSPASNDNLKYTYDGETGKLKSVEMI